MTDAPLTDLDAVDRLAADFSAAGYGAERVPRLLGEDAHLALGGGQRWPALHVTARAAAAGSALATLTRLFLLGTSEPAERVAAALPSLGLAGAIAAGAVEYDGPRDHGSVRATVDIRPHADDVRSYLVVSDFDADERPGRLRADHVLGIGAASVMLARMVIRRPVGRVLDLGTGCGIQSLHCAAHAESVTATDTNPRALALAAATARLNEITFDLRRGSLFEPVAGEKFDLIVSNPPFVISPGAARFEYRDSGMPGDELCRSLVTRLPEYLNPGGTAQLLANWMIRGDADWRLSVAPWVASTGCDGWVVQREVAHPAEYVSMWLADTGEDGGPEAAETAAEWLDYFAAEGVTGIGMGSITLRMPTTAAQPDVLFDELTGPDDQLSGPEVDALLARRAYLSAVSDADLLEARLSLAATGLLEQRLVVGADGWTPVLRMVQRPGGPGARIHLDEWGQALFAGCTGALRWGDLVELLAAAHGIDADQLAAALMPTVRMAITRGILHPVGEAAR